MNKKNRYTRKVNGTRQSKGPDEFDTAVIATIIGVIILLVVLLNKTFHFSIPIFGKEADILGWDWDIYIRRNWFWMTISIMLIVGGIIRIVVILNKINKGKKNT